MCSQPELSIIYVLFKLFFPRLTASNLVLAEFSEAFWKCYFLIMSDCHAMQLLYFA